ncbi:hypothetical protein [Paraburkholderia sp. BL21I4N1]|uniref:hypothetical protein n=1 Tax=Paraburkholderia sp. BL21I4N1 TaxID=1938801 RepID=UPI000CFD25F4|nr:hypothetical protein [Paraburkholderia sp. BL21I4N1]PQV48765.1 hypothetical protein B0G83_108295 [Paraburkholderia sp. BL21I4N1]
MNTVMREFIKAAKEAPRLFFLPVTGAIEAVRREMEDSRCNRHPNEPANARSHDGAQDRR